MPQYLQVICTYLGLIMYSIISGRGLNVYYLDLVYGYRPCHGISIPGEYRCRPKSHVIGLHFVNIGAI